MFLLHHCSCFNSLIFLKRKKKNSRTVVHSCKTNDDPFLVPQQQWTLLFSFDFNLRRPIWKTRQRRFYATMSHSIRMHFSILEESKQKNKNGEREPKKKMQN
uniref:(northern house mosquito) hypothetical protein n=1 Tax=Culex pipiens TaxID=7175 RepID=A0A8D8L2R5_CULPI